MARWFGLWLAITACFSLSSRASAQELVGPRLQSLEAREAALALELEQLQRATRIYLRSWCAANTSLAAAQFAIAWTSDSDAVSTNYYVGAGLSAASLGMLLLGYSWPGLRARQRFRERPAATREQREARIAFGQALISEQNAENRAAGRPWRHALAAAIALGSGVRAGMSFGSVVQGVGRTLFVLLMLELQILTRPGSLLAPQRESPEKELARVSWEPWLGRHEAGLRLVGKL